MAEKIIIEEKEIGSSLTADEFKYVVKIVNEAIKEFNQGIELNSEKLNQILSANGHIDISNLHIKDTYDGDGALYNGNVMFDDRKLTSSDLWRFPTLADWSYTQEYCGGESTAGGKLKDIGYENWPGDQWNSVNIGATNEFGFKARGLGNRAQHGPFQNKGMQVIYWAKTDDGALHGAQIVIYSGMLSLAVTLNKAYGSPIRFVRDITDTEVELPDGIISEKYVGNDAKKYLCVKIGNLIWTQEIAETQFRNGNYLLGFDNGIYTQISDEIWVEIANNDQSAMCFYNNVIKEKYNYIPFDFLDILSKILSKYATISRLEQESTERNDACNYLNQYINNELSARIEADNALQENIDNLANFDEITYENLQNAVINSALRVGMNYKITDRGDRGIVVKAISPNQLSSDATRFMLCPATYAEVIDESGNTWKGVWNSSKVFDVDDLTIWNGLVWKCIVAVTQALNSPDQNSVHWALIPKSSLTDNEYVEIVFSCIYDFQSDSIVKQWDNSGNVFCRDYNNPDINYCDLSDWNFATSGNPFYNNNCFGVFNNSNDIYIVDNKLTGCIKNNVFAAGWGIYFNNIVGDIDNNTNNDICYNNCFGIMNNSNSGQIAWNSLNGSISGNSTCVEIYNNKVNGAISNNSNTGSIMFNSNGADIAGNSNAGDISNNSNAGEISNNTGVGNIRYNNNNGSIISNEMIEDITDVKEDKIGEPPR